MPNANSNMVYSGLEGYTPVRRATPVYLQASNPVRYLRPRGIKPAKLALQPTPTPAEAACQPAWLHDCLTTANPRQQACESSAQMNDPCLLVRACYFCGELRCNCVLKWKKCSCVSICSCTCYMVSTKTFILLAMWGRMSKLGLV